LFRLGPVDWKSLWTGCFGSHYLAVYRVPACGYLPVPAEPAMHLSGLTLPTPGGGGTCEVHPRACRRLSLPDYHLREEDGRS
jgi:hypothetical protein